MGKTDQTTSRSDAEVAEEILRRKILTPGQLKAALDYQASVGGNLVDVMRKLGLVADDVLDDFVADFAGSGDEGKERSGQAKTLPIDPAKLRVHRKLLEKVPHEVVERYGILFFFPPPGTRAILMSCESPMGTDGLQKLQNLLGVEIRTVDLPPGVRERWLEEVGAGKGKGHSSRVHPTESGEHRDPFRGATRPAKTQKPTGPAVDVAEDRALVRGLAQLLVKKGIVQWDEIAVEVELVKRAQNRVKNDKAQRLIDEGR